MPDGVTIIDRMAFYNCAKLVEIHIPNSVTQIGIGAFESCNFTSINLPSKLTVLDTGVFYNCHLLQSVEIPKGVTTIGWRTFYNCNSLKTLFIPNTLIDISDAFPICYNLEFVTLEDGFNGNNLILSASTLYSVETMVSWFEALADRTGQATYTLTIGSTNLAKLTAEQLEIATNKNWLIE